MPECAVVLLRNTTVWGHVCKHGGLECCITAVWRKVVARDECLYDSDAHWAQREERQLKGVMQAGLGALAK